MKGAFHMYSALELTDNKSEIIQYNVPNLPIKASHFSQEDYPSLSIVNHWHTEFEFKTLPCGTASMANSASCCRGR